MAKRSSMMMNLRCFVFIFYAVIVPGVWGGSLKGPSLAFDIDDSNNEDVFDEFPRSLEEALENVQRMTNDHILRRLQAPTRACGETVGIVTAEEIRALSDIYITILFERNPNDASFEAIARNTLLGQVTYDTKVVKVCMSCSEAAAVLSADVVGNTDEVYGFPSYCSEGMYGADQRESAIVFIPLDKFTGEVVSGSMRGIISSRGTAFILANAPSERLAGNWTQYLSETEVMEIEAANRHVLVPAIYAGSGAVGILPDFLGYGESYLVDRPYLNYKQGYARSQVLAWLATREYIRSEGNGCSDLEARVSLAGYSEGGYAAVLGGLALRDIGVTIQAVYAAGSPFQPDVQTSYSFGLFAEDAPPLTTFVIIAQQAIIALSLYAYSNEFPFMANTGTGQRALSDEYTQGNFTTNALSWFKSPAQIGFGFLGFTPFPPTLMVNPDILAVYNEARAAGSMNACAEFATNTTDKLCEAILENSLFPELEAMVDFPTSICHSQDDELVTINNSPTFPFVNPFVEEYTGVPVIDILKPGGGHEAAYLTCNIAPILRLNIQGEDFPAKITPLDLCTGTPATDAPVSAPATEAPAAAKTDSTDPPVESSTDEPTMAPDESNAEQLFWRCAFVAPLLLVWFAL